AAALGAVATTFAEYALRLRGDAPIFGSHDADVHYVAAMAILLHAAVNVIGVRWSALVLELTVFAKYGALVFLVIIAVAIHPLVVIATVPSAFGTRNCTPLYFTPVYFAMAEDGFLFKSIAAVHPRFPTAHVAIALDAALDVVFVLLPTFDQLADTFVTAIVPFY